MKKYIYIGIAFIILIGIISFQQKQLKKVKTDRDVYKTNTTVLMSDLVTYKTKDSLNAVSVGNLELKISEYKKYREDDFKLIESLKVDKNRLQTVVTANTETINELKGKLRDSIRIVYNDRDVLQIDTLRCITKFDEWYDVDICLDSNNEYEGYVKNREKLKYVEHIIPKRFWFIKWGTKERRQEILSLNPNTEITGAEYVTIRK